MVKDKGTTDQTVSFTSEMVSEAIFQGIILETTFEPVIEGTGGEN